MNNQKTIVPIIKVFCQRCFKPVRGLEQAEKENCVLRAASCSCTDSQDEITFEQEYADETWRVRLESRYTILSELGQGGMATVFVAEDRRNGKLVALKVLREDLEQNELAVRRFREEVEAARYLNHPNMVSIYDCTITDDGAPYIVMEYVDGANLSDLIKQEGALDSNLTLDIFLGVTSALSDAHKKDIVHRDIKPENILVAQGIEGNLQTKVVDFGIAKVLYETGEDRGQQTTHSTDVVGSPLYMSPEQCMGLPVDKRTDVYSLGCVMYEALTGSPPFHSANPVKTVLMHMYDFPKSFRQVNPGLNCPWELELIVQKCLRKDPRQRYQTIADLEKDLLAIKGKKITKAAQELHPVTIAAGGFLVGIIAFVLINPLSALKIVAPEKVVEIKDRYTGKPIYTTMTSKSIREAVQEAVWKKTDLAGADLKGVNLSGLDLEGAKLRESNLASTSLSQTTLTNSDLNHADLSGAVANGAKMEQINLIGANLSNSQLRTCNLSAADLRNADLSYAQIIESTMPEINLDRSDIDKAKFINIFNPPPEIRPYLKNDTKHIEESDRERK